MKKKFTPSEKESAVKMLAAGSTYAQVMKKFGCSSSILSLWKQKYAAKKACVTPPSAKSDTSPSKTPTAATPKESSAQRTNVVQGAKLMQDLMMVQRATDILKEFWNTDSKAVTLLLTQTPISGKNKNEENVIIIAQECIYKTDAVKLVHEAVHFACASLLKKPLEV